MNLAIKQENIHRMKTSIKLAGIELTQSELSEAIANGKTFLAKGKTLYAILTNSQGVTFARPVYNERGTLPLVPRGRFAMLTGAEANKLCGIELCLA